MGEVASMLLGMIGLPDTPGFVVGLGCGIVLFYVFPALYIYRVHVGRSAHNSK